MKINSFLQKTKDHKILIIIFLLALVLRIIFVFSSPIKMWDETVYANLGYDLSKNPFDYSVANNGWSDYIPSGGDNFYSWPKIGFRAPLLPYLLAIFYSVKLDFLIEFFMPLVGALSVFALYLLGKKLFNEKIALYSAAFLAFLPLHVYYSAKILTDVLFTFFVIITFIAFWKGFEENKNKYKIYFGISLALALLSRYTTLWIIPVFFIYLLIRNKSLNFLKDTYLWYSILAFSIALVPWFIYGIFQYNTPLGALIHGFKASTYWGGMQSWNFFFVYWWQMFSIIGLFFLISVFYILYKKEFFKKEIYLLLIWFLFFIIMIIYMPHKEERFILALSPVICLMAAYLLNKIKYLKNFIFYLAVIVSLCTIFTQFSQHYNEEYTENSLCAIESNKFLKDIDKNSIVITEESSITYHYTKLETKFYPNPWNYQKITQWLTEDYFGKEVYILFVRKISKTSLNIETDLEKNAYKVFSCGKNDGGSAIYKLN